MNLRKDIEITLIEWNESFPFDLLWRRKYNVSWGSPQHREMSFFSMIMDLKEDTFIKKIVKEQEYQEEADVLKEFNVMPGKYVNMSPKEIDKEFDDLDLSKF